MGGLSSCVQSIAEAFRQLSGVSVVNAFAACGILPLDPSKPLTALVPRGVRRQDDAEYAPALARANHHIGGLGPAYVLGDDGPRGHPALISDDRLAIAHEDHYVAMQQAARRQGRGRRQYEDLCSLEPRPATTLSWDLMLGLPAHTSG